MQAILLLFIVSMIGFAILHLAPGGPMSQFAEGGDMTQADLDRIAEQLGLNRPAAGAICRVALAHAERRLGALLSRPAAGAAHHRRHLGADVRADGLTSTLLAMLLGAWIGILGAMKRYSLFDSSPRSAP
jgi:peptide/nickel transport system permease protein